MKLKYFKSQRLGHVSRQNKCVLNFLQVLVLFAFFEMYNNAKKIKLFRYFLRRSIGFIIHIVIIQRLGNAFEIFWRFNKTILEIKLMY